MKTIILLLLISFLIGCKGKICDLPADFEDISKIPEEEQLLGSYKILDDTSRFRIILEKGDFRNELKIIGNPPWCSSSNSSETGGTWSLTTGGIYYSDKDYGVIIYPDEKMPGLGLGNFIIKKYNGHYSFVFPWHEGMEKCERYTTLILTCDIITFIKE